MILYETERYIVKREGKKLKGWEKKHRVLKDNKLVLVKRMEDPKESTCTAMEKIAKGIFSSGEKVAIKINIGGGIDGVPSSYTDPKIVEGVIDFLVEVGADPFVCEADMRTIRMTPEKLEKRGNYWSLLEKKGIPFINLSTCRSVEFYPDEIDFSILLPEILLRPSTRIVSVAPPKHHWECGVSLAQKNMYGAISEPRKSIYHRKYGEIDKVVAACARVLSPDVSIVGARKLCSGLGPHFCIPVDFNFLIVANDMLRCDLVASDILSYPYEKVGYAMINSRGEKIDYELHPDSDEVDEVIRRKIKENLLTPFHLSFWKPFLWWQYFVPHLIQSEILPKFEWVATLVNKLFYEPRGD
jgi:uncharacterized protein (DUF362 family)